MLSSAAEVYHMTAPGVFRLSMGPAEPTRPPLPGSHCGRRQDERQSDGSQSESSGGWDVRWMLVRQAMNTPRMPTGYQALF